MSPVEAHHIRNAVYRARAEVSELVADGILSPDARTVTDVHDVCDANTLAGMCDDDDNGFFAYSDVVLVLAYVDAWLMAGRPTGQHAPNDYLSTMAAEQGRALDAALVA